jgi:uncharacterized repeat protein (TIGR03803 family)
LRRLLWAAALLLPAFAARADVVFTNLYSFTGTNDGASPAAALVQGTDGYFYGTTYGGGTNDAGTVFKISSKGVLTRLYSFGSVQNTNGYYSLDGGNPNTALVQGPDGYLYGTTSGGGTNLDGTVFKINSTGALTSLYSFGSVQNTNNANFPLDGAAPLGLVQGNDGYFYGTTGSGGTNGYGTVFKISSTGALTSLYSFGSIQDSYGNPLDGATPSAALVQGSDGNFYGTTEFGGTNNAGTVFKISTNGTLTTLHVFTPGNDGAAPSAALVQGSDGYFYGTTAFVIQDRDGFIFSAGTVFRISSNGALTTLYTFTGGSDGGKPQAALVQGSDGSLYGTTAVLEVRWRLGWNVVSLGTAFKITTNGAFTTLYSFTGGSDGSDPNGLLQGRDGNLYGTTSQVYSQGPAGTIFRLTIVPEFQSLTLTNGTLNLTWSTEAGGIYQLQASASLSTPNWTNLGSPVTATNGTFTFTDSVTNTPQRFYRVSLAP